MLTSTAVSVLGFWKLVEEDVLPHCTWVFEPWLVSTMRQFWLPPELSQLDRPEKDPALVPTTEIAAAGLASEAVNVRTAATVSVIRRIMG
jgi:hypothetical protein